MTVTCSYCRKIVHFPADKCDGCGEALPAWEIKQPKPDRTPVIIGGTAMIILGVVVVLGFVLFAARTEESTQQTTNVQVVTTPATEAIIENVRLSPAETITDSALRQALEFYFRREISRIEWSDIEQIKTIVIESEAIFLSESHIPVANMYENAEIISITTDAQVSQMDQLGYFENLEVLAIRTAGQISSSTLEGLTNLAELEYRANRNLTDLTPLTGLSGLRRLTITGGNLTSLQGLSELRNLYAISFRSTGLTDLSLLNQQQNITDLTLYRNNDLASISTLETMTWLTSLHIERMDELNLHVISNLTNLESLTIIRTDARSYDFIIPLTNLRYLRLFNNRDVPEIPTLSGFSQLEELHIDNVRNRGSARPVDFLNGVTTLRKLTWHDHDSLEPLRQMTDLEVLHLNPGWHLTDASPLAALTNLDHLRIYEGRTNDLVENMDAIGQLTQLRHLDLSENSTGQYTLFFNWDFLSNLTNLQYLNITGNTVIGNFSWISNLQQLTTLEMENIRLITDFTQTRDGGFVNTFFGDRMDVTDFASDLSQLTNLTTLNISNNGIRDISFTSQLTNLEILLASVNYIADISPLAELSRLELVDLRRNAITNWSAVDDLIDTLFLGR